MQQHVLDDGIRAFAVLHDFFEIAAQRVAGDAWTFVAIEAQTKLVLSWLVARRDAGSATEFLQDVADRISTRIQLTTDGLKVYLEAVEGAFGAEIDYAQLVKLYGASQEETRYSPAECIGADIRVIQGDPDPAPVEVLSIPGGQLLIYVILAGLAGVAAAAFPARRAARLDVLSAIAYE